MSTKSKFTLSSIFAAIAAFGFLLCFCVTAFSIGEAYREYNYNITLGDFTQIFHEWLYDYIIYLILAVSVVLYRKDARALPIVLLTYMAYFMLVFAGRFLFFTSGGVSDIIGLLCLSCGAVAAIIWIVNPQRFKWLSLLFVPYIIYPLFFLLINYEYIEDVWVVVLNISEMILFISVVLKCTMNDDIDKHIVNKTYYYWVPSVVAILVQCFAYLIIVA